MKKVIRVYLVVNARTWGVRLSKRPNPLGPGEVRVRVNLTLDIPPETEAVLNATISLPRITVEQIDGEQEAVGPLAPVQEAQP